MTKKVLPTTVSDNVLKPKTTTSVAANQSTTANTSTRSLTNRTKNTKVQPASAVLPTEGSYNFNIGDNCFSFCSEQDVFVNIVENITEQKYIKNIEGAGALCAGTINSSNVYTNIVNNVCKLGFDTDSGFEVTDLGSGLAKIGMNSTFKYWEVNGNPGLTACGLDTVNFVAGSGVTITSDNSTVPKSLTISATSTGGVSSLNSLTGALTLSAGNNISIGSSGNTLTLCSTSVATPPGGCNTQFQYNNSGSFAGASGLTYNNLTGSVGMFSITTPQDVDLDIEVSDTGPASWYSLYGNPLFDPSLDFYSTQASYDSAGNIYMVGANGSDGIPYLTKFDKFGTIVWQKVFNESNNYYKTGDGVIVDSSDNVYCVIGTDDTIDSFTIFKINSSGTVIWQTQYESSTAYVAGCTGLSVDSSGNVYACVFYDDGADQQLVIKLDNTGNILWQKILNPAANGFPYDIAVDSTGNVYTIGDGATGILVLKYNSAGVLQWQKEFNNTVFSSSADAFGIDVDSSDNIYFTGSMYSDPLNNAEWLYVVKLDPSGNIIWQTNLEYNDNNYAGGIKVIGTDIYVGGTAKSGYNIVKYDTSGNLIWQRLLKSNTLNETMYWYWSSKAIDANNETYILNGYVRPEQGFIDCAFVLQMPVTGSGIGSYGLFDYVETNYPTNTTQLTSTVVTHTDGTGTVTGSTGPFTLSVATNVHQLGKLFGGNNILKFNSNGLFAPGDYTLPIGGGLNKQVLTLNGYGNAGWAEPNIYLNNRCTLRISSLSDQNSENGGCYNFIAGYGALNQGSTYAYSNNNTAIGLNSQHNNVCGSNNFSAGPHSLYCLCTFGNNNTAIGYGSLRNMTCGYSNVAIGYGALQEANGACMNIGIGYNTLQKLCNAGDNIAIGGCSMYCHVTGNHNISLGWKSLQNHVCGSDNIAIGGDSQNSNICGFENISLGSRSLYNNTDGYRNIAIGTYPLYRNTGGDGNIAIGIATLEFNTTGSGSVAIGEWALQNNRTGCTVGVGQGSLSQNTTGFANTAVGTAALQLNTIGSCNTAIGYGPLVCNTAGCSNTVIGFSAHRWGNGGSGNTAVGALALESSSGQCNVAVGAEALRFNTTGQLNVAIGSGTLACNTIGYGNTAVGYQALNKNSTGNWNIAIGLFAAQNNLVGQNIAIGDSALNQNTIGVNHVAIGSNALRYNTTGLNNTAVGNSALLCNTIGSCNFALGQSALRCNATGCANVAIGVSSLEKNCGSWNVAIGNGSLYQNTTGEFNLAIGANALENNTIGFRNVAIGRSSLLFNTCGGENMAIGFASLYLNTTGSFNTAIGGFAMYGNTTGCRNTAIGLAALRSTRNNENVAIGFNTLFNTLGGCNTAIGASAGYGMTNGCNNTLIGWSASAQTATSCNTITLGNSSISCIRAQVTTISALSDQRDKTNIQDLPLGLQFILDLRPVKFTWNMRDGGKVGVDDTGFIAQEVLSVEDKYKVAEYLDMVGRENPEKLEIKPAKLIPILVKAIQELSDKVDRLQNQVNSFID